MWKERSAPARRFAPEDFLISRAACTARHHLDDGRWELAPNSAAAGSLPCPSGVGSRSGFCPVAISTMDLASLGVLISWTGNESISRNPSGVPVLDSCTAHGAFKAADFALLCNVLASVVNRAAFTSAMIGF
jgi:hypothetical protein